MFKAQQWNEQLQKAIFGQLSAKNSANHRKTFTSHTFWLRKSQKNWILKSWDLFLKKVL